MPRMSAKSYKRYNARKAPLPRPLIISAFPACGKTYAVNNLQEKYHLKMVDSDSSKFSWTENHERNPEFPDNYIQHIHELCNMPDNDENKPDIIFVSSHEVVRNALIKNNIKYILCYPSTFLKDEWMRRIRERGNDENFIKFIDDNYMAFIHDIEYMDGKGLVSHFMLDKENDSIETVIQFVTNY